MEDVKKYGVCKFCNSKFILDDSEGLCVVCLKAYEPEDRPYDQAADEFRADQEAELKMLMDASVKRNQDSHAMPNTNFLNADLEARKSKEHLQYIRAKALEMAYYTSHKMGHFSMKIPKETEMTEKEKFLYNVKEVKDLARINMQFILEG